MQINPAYEENNIAVVLAADSNFVPYLSVAIQSLIDNTSEQYNYDIIILFSDPIAEVERRFSVFSRENVSIRFIDVQDYMARGAATDLWYSRAHYSKAMYYRFFIPELFGNYNKILYLDSDIIINSDIAELYNIELNDNYVGAVKDLHLAITEHLSTYAKEVLKILPEKYFNSGVMLFNVDKLKKINWVELCLKTLQKLNKPMCPDQDVLNIVCYDNIKYLDYKYNIFQMDLQNSEFLEKISEDIATEFKNAAKNFVIIHYAGWKKPWRYPNIAYADYFWKHARKSPYYEIILSTNITYSGITKEQVRNVVYRKKLYMTYIRCKLLKLITFGKKQEHYSDKMNKLKTKIKDYRNILNVK